MPGLKFSIKKFIHCSCMRDQGIDSVWWWNRFQQHTVAYIFPLMSWLMRILVFLLWILSLVKSLSTLHKCNSTIIFSPGWYNYVLHVWHWDPPFIVMMKAPSNDRCFYCGNERYPKNAVAFVVCSCIPPQSVWGQACMLMVMHLSPVSLTNLLRVYCCLSSCPLKLVCSVPAAIT